jgi:CRISPR-associated protein Csb1
MEQSILGPDNEIDPAFKGISYVRAELNGSTNTFTNSLIEAHRINSPFIISNAEFQEQFMEDASYRKQMPIDWRKIASALFKYDMNSLLHGVFLANLGDGRIKVQRAVTGYIEATNVNEVVSGGVKNNAIDPTGTLRAENYDKDVYGNVPYHRVEYSAERITAYFNMDLALLRSYELGESAFNLLVSLALYKICSFLGNGMRLRTACDLKRIGEINVKSPDGWTFPEGETLRSAISELIPKCQDLFAKPPVTELKTKVKIKEKKEESEA